jgi:hypothetical protein
MWIRYWANFKYSCGQDSLNEKYFWSNSAPRDDKIIMKEYVREWAESTFDYQCQQDAERIHFDYDYELDVVIPEETRKEMIENNLANIEQAVSNLTHLGYKK